MLLVLEMDVPAPAGRSPGFNEKPGRAGRDRAEPGDASDSVASAARS
jgi:hypothetical protein